MNIVIFTYSISWICILLIGIIRYFLYSDFFDELKMEKWYGTCLMVIIFILAAPIVALLSLFALCKNELGTLKYRVKQKVQKEENNKIEEHKREAERCYQIFKEKGDVESSTELSRTALITFLEAKNGNYKAMFARLGAISTVKNSTLFVKLCERSGIGDESRIMVRLEDNSTERDILKYITVENSPMGALQVYILSNLSHVLPFWWHGGYNAREYIFSYHDIIRNKLSNKVIDVRDFLIKYDFSPKVYSDNDRYYVSCCYWSDWKGLIREVVEVTIQNNTVVEIFNVSTEIIYSYNCGVRL